MPSRLLAQMSFLMALCPMEALALSDVLLGTFPNLKILKHRPIEFSNASLELTLVLILMVTVCQTQSIQFVCVSPAV
jgi:hypothetical protein